MAVLMHSTNMRCDKFLSRVICVIYYLQVTCSTSKGRLKELRDGFEYHWYDKKPTARHPQPRKGGNCNGGYECLNSECYDIAGDGGKNCSAFLIVRDRKGKPSAIFCRICSYSEFVRHHPCGATKFLTLPVDSCLAYVSLKGAHNATCTGLRCKQDTSSVVSKLHDIINLGKKQVLILFT